VEFEVVGTVFAVVVERLAEQSPWAEDRLGKECGSWGDAGLKGDDGQWAGGGKRSTPAGKRPGPVAVAQPTRPLVKEPMEKGSPPAVMRLGLAGWTPPVVVKMPSAESAG
jgi:hypothetical protein